MIVFYRKEINFFVIIDSVIQMLFLMAVIHSILHQIIRFFNLFSNTDYIIINIYAIHHSLLFKTNTFKEYLDVPTFPMNHLMKPKKFLENISQFMGFF